MATAADGDWAQTDLLPGLLQQVAGTRFSADLVASHLVNALLLLGVSWVGKRRIIFALFL